MICYRLLLIFIFLLSSCTHYSTYEEARQSYYQNDYARSFQQLWNPAKQHDPRALYAMGYMYYYGIGTDKDQDLGRSLITQSAKLNYIPAIIALKRITAAHHEQYLPFERYPKPTGKQS